MLLNIDNSFELGVETTKNRLKFLQPQSSIY